MHGIWYVVRKQVVAVILQVIKRPEFLWLFIYKCLILPECNFWSLFEISFLVVRASLLGKRETGVYLFLKVVLY